MPTFLGHEQPAFPPAQRAMTPPQFHFRPSQRMHTPGEYEATFAQKHSAGDAVLLVFVSLRESGPTRLGTSVGKRCGNSVVRHAIKRSIREAFRLLQHELPASIEIVVVPRPGATPTTAQVRESFPKLVDKAVKKARRPPRSSVSDSVAKPAE